MEQQQGSVTLCMGLFLVTEIRFFGGLFLAYLLYRVWYPEAWAEGSVELDIVLGGLNTVVLIASSLTMALAVRSAQVGAPRATVRWLGVTMALGTTFLVVKGFEYAHKFQAHHVPGPDFMFDGPHAQQVEIFMSLYFAMTGLHALHMVIGIALLSVIAWMAHRRHRLDITLSAALPRGPGASLRVVGRTRPMSGHIAPVRSYVLIFSLL